MEVETPIISSDSASDYLDAECGDDVDEESEAQDYFQESDVDQDEQKLVSIISEIREELGAGSSQSAAESSCAVLNASVESLAVSTSTSSSSAATIEDVHDYMHDSVWRGHRKHIFILSEAGKPIYSLHGNEDKLATLFGVIQALVSFVQHGEDAITSIHAQGIKFVFLVRNALILVAASRTAMSVPQLQMQLSDVYNQILSTITYAQMTKIFEQRKNFDLRRLLRGSERFIYHLLSNDSTNKKISNNVFTFLTNSIRVMPLASAVRANIVSAIQSNCSKIKNLVFAVLIANNKLITLVRMKKYSIQPADLRLIFNLIECSESFKTHENWTPICLPKFDMNGYLYTHVSYLTDDCQACLLLLSVDRDDFFTLSDARRRITEKLQRMHCLEAIADAINKRSKEARLNLQAMGVSELRHFLYKPRGMAQLLCSELQPPYSTLAGFERLESIYCRLLHRIHNTARPLKLVYEVKECEVVLAWVTGAYELYAVFEPFVDRSVVIKHVDKLIKSIEKEYDVFFIRHHPNF